MSSSNPTRPKLAANPQARREGEIKGQEAQINSFAWPCCLNCEHWDDKQEICKEYEARPPANVIVVGCVGYTPHIPF